MLALRMWSCGGNELAAFQHTRKDLVLQAHFPRSLQGGRLLAFEKLAMFLSSRESSPNLCSVFHMQRQHLMRNANDDHRESENTIPALCRNCRTHVCWFQLGLDLLQEWFEFVPRDDRLHSLAYLQTRVQELRTIFNERSGNAVGLKAIGRVGLQRRRVAGRGANLPHSLSQHLVLFLERSVLRLGAPYVRRQLSSLQPRTLDSFLQCLVFTLEAGTQEASILPEPTRLIGVLPEVCPPAGWRSADICVKLAFVIPRQSLDLDTLVPMREAPTRPAAQHTDRLSLPRGCLAAR
mmetsp:Transcript_43505/g.114791  ORF Transcript_43505/g.114791 Transcript_43505/m.114791 type:complete len:293 (-) Transcript_43505:116-994(-)